MICIMGGGRRLGGGLECDITGFEDSVCVCVVDVSSVDVVINEHDNNDEDEDEEEEEEEGEEGGGEEDCMVGLLLPRKSKSTGGGVGDLTIATRHDDK